MKNNKLLIRLFALLASLVLVVAFALPCFADDLSQASKFDFVRVGSYDDFVNYYQTDDSLGFVPAFVAENKKNTRTYGVVSTSVSNNGSTVYLYTSYLVLGAETAKITISFYSSGSITFSMFTYDVAGTATRYDVSTDWSSIDVRLMVPIAGDASSGGGSDSPASSDMYSNLFNILKDAVYGSDAELTGSQEYALTLISTILTYATILLPVILVIFIAVWCFKRF